MHTLFTKNNISKGLRLNTNLTQKLIFEVLTHLRNWYKMIVSASNLQTGTLHLAMHLTAPGCKLPSNSCHYSSNPHFTKKNFFYTLLLPFPPSPSFSRLPSPSLSLRHFHLRTPTFSLSFMHLPPSFCLFRLLFHLSAAFSAFPPPFLPFPPPFPPFSHFPSSNFDNLSSSLSHLTKTIKVLLRYSFKNKVTLQVLLITTIFKSIFNFL